MTVAAASVYRAAMPVKRRRPKERTRSFTPEALDAFRRMQAAETDEEWSAAHSVLWHEIGAKLWEWPCVEDPRDECPYPPGCEGARRWHESRAQRPEAFELYYQLVEASAERAVQCGQLEAART